MSRHRMVAGLLAAAVVGGAALAFRALNDGPGGGPLDDGGGGIEQGGPADVGGRYSYGAVLLTNDGDAPAVIEEIRLRNVGGPLRLLGIHTHAIPDGDNGLVGGADVFPPVGFVNRPLAEQNVVPVSRLRTPAGTPGEGLEIILGLAVSRPEVGRYHGLEVTYRVGGRRYREVYDQSVFLCAPSARWPETDCSIPKDSPDFGDGTLP